MSVDDEKILLILDLDETLMHASKDPPAGDPDFMIFDYYVRKRPFLDNFLSFCSKNFRLAVWSSASDDYVEEAVRYLFPPSIPLEFVWGRSRCTYKADLDLHENSNNGRDHIHFIKRLSKVKAKGYTLQKILIIDDSPYKLKENYGNAIYIREYLGEKEDEELKYLTYYLDSLKDCKNVRKIEKRGWRMHKPEFGKS